MENDIKLLALIPVRKGSKRLPGKNVRKLDGIPLLTWTIRAAKQSKYINRLLLSSDDLEAIQIAKNEGCDVPFIRPSSLATDSSSSYDVAAHALQSVGEKYDWLILLQPTSPLRNAKDIDSAIELILLNKKNSLISVSHCEKSHLMYFMLEKQKLVSPYGISIKELNNLRSQDMPKPCEINGAIYIVKVDWFLREKTFFDDDTIPYVMPSERSVNIDTEFDWRIAEAQINTERLKEKV